MDLKGAEIRNFRQMGLIINDNSKKSHPLKIPHYQRPYRWSAENVEKLINDWFSHQDDSDYFCGSIVTVTYENKPHDLIDGQQRFTTLFLANYMYFLVLRALVFSSLKHTYYVMEFKTIYGEMKECLKYFVDLDHEDSIIKQQSLDDLEYEISNFIRERQYGEAIDLFCTVFPEESNTSKVTQNTLLLQYDRSSFNDSLKKVLSKTTLSLNKDEDIDFKIIEDESDVFTENEKKYCESLETIFECIKEKIVYKKSSNSEIKSVQLSLSFKKIISSFTDEVKVCIVQTGNPEDAYTLFEVLNDRALALDDLDLIKNEFYKNFVLYCGTKTSEEKKDNILQSLDDQWVNDIYDNTRDYEKKLITYLSIVYITGSDSITYDKSKDYREALKNYFRGYQRDNSYKDINIERDFNIFLAIKNFIGIFKIRHQNRDLLALEAEYNDDISINAKLVLILIAKDQQGVLTGFTNFILRKIEDSNSNFDPTKVKDILENLYKTESNCETEYIEIHQSVSKQADEIWHVTMKSKDATSPRAFSNRIIKLNFLNSHQFSIIKRDVEEDKLLDEEFGSWLNQWKYKNNSNTLSIRILFARLIKMQVDSNGALHKASITKTISQENVKNMQLDHIEPRIINKDLLEKYFQHTDREHYTDGLGNMMPLPGIENKIKSNRPVIDSFEIYENAGLKDHFILTQTQQCLKQNSQNNVPTVDFFIERKKVCIDWFKELLS